MTTAPSRLGYNESMLENSEDAEIYTGLAPLLFKGNEPEETKKAEDPKRREEDAYSINRSFTLLLYYSIFLSRSNTVYNLSIPKLAAEKPLVHFTEV
jgi:hypothetical protein